ncbi:P-loop containing nucleoside triphosphate hydrolase protein [Cercophora newfieldiana]|uniref:P-loop containing nucleoside triphosphate hydrolase protein n=1 Tax=Cercophora newfieldiana TaxID=92897 RepID=A0AA40CI93_9PEZI|nr:P-loop containing nucleoside triphosphate hydrolase protein [Cercophora newfieldiana]
MPVQDAPRPLGEKFVGSAAHKEPAQTEKTVDELLDKISRLEAENKALKTDEDVPPSFQIFFFIQVFSGENRSPGTCAYLEEPSWSIGPRGEVGLKAQFPVADVEGYLRERSSISFVIAKFYSATFQNNEVQAAIRNKHALPKPEPFNETIRLQSEDMVEAAEQFFKRQPKFNSEFPDFGIRGQIPSPYLFWYHYRCPEAFSELSKDHRFHMQLLTDWIEEAYGAMYSRVEDQLKRGVVSSETVPFLVKPGDALISSGKGSTRAYIAASWPSKLNAHSFARSSGSAEFWSKTGDPAKDKITWSWDLRAWCYKYNGKFYKHFTTEKIDLLANAPDTEVPIVDLDLYPAQYAPSETTDLLRSRGETFWSCRKQRLVAYRDENGIYGSNTDRFMVDFHTYRQLHSDLVSFKRSFLSQHESTEYLSDERMEDDQPPSEPEIYVFPGTIIGYNLHKKKWVDLIVDRISDVNWNKQAFRSLVIDEGTKELVQALVTNQVAQEQGTDLIDGKGNGLIMLLHGSPGTGKTYTAEGVAEMAEKPLFRVTCGDIGTKPEDVEKYLESALHLGKSWGCVVLLDEADVFLEQRTLTDLDRNALVSVFLRVLEYYEGILILTSNRVGTFDEAFKSRIQLSLRYENLSKPQRHKIWKNFLSRLKDMDKDTSAKVTEPGSRKRKLAEPTGIDFDDIECYFEELAAYELNGRQIRNAITTARQLAKFQGKRMTYEHLKRVITVASKFDTYLKKVQDDFSDDQIARGAGIR